MEVQQQSKGQEAGKDPAARPPATSGLPICEAKGVGLETSAALILCVEANHCPTPPTQKNKKKRSEDLICIG